MKAMPIPFYAFLSLAFAVSVIGSPLKFNSNIRKAQVFQSANGEFVLRKDFSSQGLSALLASVEYEMATNLTGWNYLYAWTNGSLPDEQQAYIAGYLEADIDSLQKMQYRNTMAGQCTSASTTSFCKRLHNFLLDNLKFMKSKILDKRNTDPFWHQVELILWQVLGMDDAYHNRTVRSAGQLIPSKLDLDPFGVFLWQVAGGDMDELSEALKTPAERASSGRNYVKTFGHCSGLVKRLPQMGDVLVAQDTWNGYNSMLRHMKLYEFNFRETAAKNSPPAAGSSQSFSSYPGLIQSGDDFYVMGSKLVTFETTNGFYNKSLYDIIRNSEGKIVFEFLRTQVANRLAKSVGEWQKYFAMFNSGTYNNQWVIVDYKKVSKGQKFPATGGVLGVSEQIPGLVVSKDMTQHLQATTYWPSYNTPYFQEIYSRSDFASMVKKYGDFFDYNKTARAQIFRRDHSKVADVKGMMRLMRYNDFKHDPLSRCACKPPYTGEYAIAARSDLNDPNGTYPFSALGHRNHGATDMKLAIPALLNDLAFIGISSPTFDQQPPFRWSKSGLNSPHFGQPDLWQFGPIRTPWKRVRKQDPNTPSFVLTTEN